MNQNSDNVCVCGKVCKNAKGVKIHQARMGCGPKLTQKQHTAQAGKTEEEVIQETHHSDHSVHVSEEAEESNERGRRSVEGSTSGEGDEIQEDQTRRVKWPAGNNKTEWEQFDEDLDAILEVSLAGSVDRKIETMTMLIYNVGKDRFGTEDGGRKGKNPDGRSNRREGEIKNIRKDLRNITKQYKKASIEEKSALEELRTTLRNKLKTLRRAERSRKRRKERNRNRARFTANPFQFVKKLLGNKASGRLNAPIEEVEEHLKKVHQDPRRNEDLGYCEKLAEPEHPGVLFAEAEPMLKEVKDVIKRARASSAPGPNGISYKVYKNCPKLTKRLWKMLKIIWRRGRLAESWHSADGCFIPKEENSEKIEQFRTISLLNVEGKIFLSVLARRLMSYLLENEYIDKSVQKGGIPGISGCIEHTSVISEIIREARMNKGNLAVIWLDLANAYGSMPHRLVDLTLQKYHVPEKFRSMVQGYFDKLQLRFSVGNKVTKYQKLEVGIVTGCTISVPLFAAAMNLLVKSVEKKSRGPYMAAGIRQPPTRAFMDDMTITAKSVIEGKWMLEDIEEMIHWARMKFKPAKSRSMVLSKGKVKKVKFKIQGEEIPTVSEKPVKCLGKWYDDTLKDVSNVKRMKAQATDWMKTVDKSQLPGKYKAWIYQHGVLPRLLWPLLVYEVPMTAVEEMERAISRYLRRWFGTPRSFSTIGLYGRGTKLQLPLSSITEEFKVTKVRQISMLEDSKDAKVVEAGIQVRTGRKWKAGDVVKQAESRLRHSDIVGTTTVGRQGIGIVKRTRWSTAKGKERREILQREVRQMEEEDRQTKAVGMKKQGSWMNWESVRKKELSWNDIWKMEPQRLSFMLRSVYDVLPSPTNLCTWGLREDPKCRLCSRIGNLEHVLSACPVALAGGRYTWRHDRVLAVIADSLERARKKERKVTRGVRFLNFVKEGQKAKGRDDAGGILATANDWQMKADLQRRLVFPAEIVTTNERPDIVIWSTSTKQVILLELTVPWEERMEEAYERKKNKYQGLVDSCQENLWKTWCMPIEVGCRGFVGQSVWRAARYLGIVGQDRKKLIAEAGREAETGSLWIWYRREEAWQKNQ